MDGPQSAAARSVPFPFTRLARPIHFIVSVVPTRPLFGPEGP
jgi:hypothetical protein